MSRRARPSFFGLLLTVAGIGLVAVLLARVLRARRPEGADGPPVITDRRPAPHRPPSSVPQLPIVEPTIVEVGDVDRPGEPEVGTAEEEAAVSADGPAPTPAKKAAVKKAVAKKKAVVKKAAAKKAVATKKAAVKKAVAKKKAPAKKAPAKKSAPPPPTS